MDRDALTLEPGPAGLLGKGTFGEVRRGTWRGCDVAIKTLRSGLAPDSPAVALFRREVAIYHTLAHPNVTQFLGAVTRDAPLMLVAELSALCCALLGARAFAALVPSHFHG